MNKHLLIREKTTNTDTLVRCKNYRYNGQYTTMEESEQNVILESKLHFTAGRPEIKLETKQRKCNKNS